MSFDPFTKYRVEKIVGDFIEARRPAPSERSNVDIKFKIDDQSLIISLVRPHWKNKDQVVETSVAKATFVKSQALWKIYWLKKDRKWHSYQALPEVNTIEDFLSELAEDPNGCFWG